MHSCKINSLMWTGIFIERDSQWSRIQSEYRAVRSAENELHFRSIYIHLFVRIIYSKWIQIVTGYRMQYSAEQLMAKGLAQGPSSTVWQYGVLNSKSSDGSLGTGTLWMAHNGQQQGQNNSRKQRAPQQHDSTWSRLQREIFPLLHLKRETAWKVPLAKSEW